MSLEQAAPGLTVADVARRYRVGEDKVRNWIRKGELVAVNTSTNLCARPRWVVSVDAIIDFEKRRMSGPTPKPKRQRKLAVKDYYPD